jgi:hypothetical protein
MDMRDILAAALAAAGGLDRLRAVRTYRAELLRAPAADPAAATAITVWRAAGGRIRIEEVSPIGRSVRVVDGDRGTRMDDPEGPGHVTPLAPGAVAEMRRQARIAPRNLLAHSAERDLAFAGEAAAPGGAPALAVDLPSESVRYLFDPGTHLCAALLDFAESRHVSFEDYRVVDGIATPFAEREGALDASSHAFTSVYVKVAYNVELPNGLFDFGF